MRWLLEFIIRYRVYVSLCVTSCMSLWMLSSSPQTQARVTRILTMSIFYPFQITADQILHARNIYAENRRLKREVASLAASVAQLREQASENGRLRSMLGFSEANPYDLLPVMVVARDPSPDPKSLVVSAGRRAGIVQYMPVVSEYGVVGKVVQVMPHFSLVQLLSDPQHRVAIMVRRSRVLGILETENSRDFFVHFRTHEDVQVADTLVTSGLGGIYPRGFVAGVVEKIIDERDPLFKKAIVRLGIDLARLEELFVIQQPPQWSALRSELDSLMGAP